MIRALSQQTYVNVIKKINNVQIFIFGSFFFINNWRWLLYWSSAFFIINLNNKLIKEKNCFVIFFVEFLVLQFNETVRQYRWGIYVLLFMIKKYWPRVFVVFDPLIEVHKSIKFFLILHQIQEFQENYVKLTNVDLIYILITYMKKRLMNETLK